MSARPTGAVNVRGRTITGGIALAAGLLLGIALIGGVEDRPDDPEPPVPEHLGPLTAVQPQLRQALLTEDEVPRPARSPGSGAAAPGAGRSEPPPAPPPGSGPPALTELCRALLADPTGLSGLWSTPPREVTTQQTPRDGGAVLHQTLGVFDAEQASAAFGRLREAAAGCDRLPVTLSDGTAVTTLLRELAPEPAEPAGLPGARQPESGTAPGAETGYAAAITIESAGGTREGWLSLDRIGPVVSVLRQLGPPGAPDPVAGDLTETRQSALGKLRRLLEALQDWRTGTG
ncbi:MAG: hypothetical protein GEV12_23120 [Micromonosporaceae bacterium]|nr:hypothetical protein [Micromonosporaceae bacterium]